jgi:hypothetical protein
MKAGTPQAVSSATPVLFLALTAENVHNDIAKDTGRGNA